MTSDNIEAEGLEAAAQTDEPEAEQTAGPGADGKRELDELQDRYLRLAAEYDNFRKRTDKERLGGRDRAQAEVVSALLEPLDDLQRIGGAEADKTTVDSLLEGIQMVERKLTRILESLGLEPLDARGKRFDPALHEALMTAPTEAEDEDDTVGEVFQSGYQFRGALIRPARVQVRKFEG